MYGIFAPESNHNNYTKHAFSFYQSNGMAKKIEKFRLLIVTLISLILDMSEKRPT